jgi:hypothetical protein
MKAHLSGVAAGRISETVRYFICKIMRLLVDGLLVVDIVIAW